MSFQGGAAYYFPLTPSTKVHLVDALILDLYFFFIFVTIYINWVQWFTYINTNSIVHCYLLDIEDIDIILKNCFQMTLYTRVPLNITKLMKKQPFCGARLSINIYIF